MVVPATLRDAEKRRVPLHQSTVHLHFVFFFFPFPHLLFACGGGLVEWLALFGCLNDDITLLSFSCLRGGRMAVRGWCGVAFCVVQVGWWVHWGEWSGGGKEQMENK